MLASVRVAAADIITGADGSRIMRWIAERNLRRRAPTSWGGGLRHADGGELHLRAQTVRSCRWPPSRPWSPHGRLLYRRECLRLATYQAVSLLTAATWVRPEVQIAKIWAGDTGHRVSYATQHVHGGTGIDRITRCGAYCLWLRHDENDPGAAPPDSAPGPAAGGG